MNFLEKVFLDMYVGMDEMISYFMEMICIFVFSCILCGIVLVLLKMKSKQEKEPEEYYIFSDLWKPIEDSILFLLFSSLVFVFISFHIYGEKESLYVMINIEIIRCIWHLYAIRYGMIVRKNNEEIAMEKKMETQQIDLCQFR